jgi:hypothetical protein
MCSASNIQPTNAPRNGNILSRSGYGGDNGVVPNDIDPHHFVVDIVANEFLEARVAELEGAVLTGYSRGKFEGPPRDRKDWYD